VRTKPKTRHASKIKQKTRPRAIAPPPPKALHKGGRPPTGSTAKFFNAVQPSATTRGRSRVPPRVPVARSEEKPGASKEEIGSQSVMPSFQTSVVEVISPFSHNLCRESLLTGPLRSPLASM